MSTNPEPIDLSADWNAIPLLADLSPNYIAAFYRCSTINPELKKLRPRALRSVCHGIDEILRPAGYSREGLSWTKGPATSTLGAAEAPNTDRRGWISRILSLGSVAGKTISRLGRNDGAVSLSLQKDRYHAGIFINVAVRNVGRHDPEGRATADRFRTYRSQSFIRDVPRNYVVDLYYYVRLVEDRRYLDFLLQLIEDRVLSFMEAHARVATPLEQLPLAREMISGKPLRLPEHERWRMFEFVPTQEMYENYAAMADFFSFALRDGRAFQGAIREVASGEFLLSWVHDALRTTAHGNPPEVPPDEWLPFSQIDPGSLSYQDSNTGSTVPVDFTVA